MAINDFKNIENINLNLDSQGQLIDSKDLNIFKSSAKIVTDFGMSKNDVIEFRIYDISNNLLEQTNGIKVRYIKKDDLPKYLKNEINPTTQERIFDIDVEKLIREAGYGNGEFKIAFNFLKNYLGSDNLKQRVWIHEVSPSRTELRIMPLLTTDETQNTLIQKRYNSFLNKGSELRSVINDIKKSIDLIENDISTLIDKYFIEKHGQGWLNVLLRDFKFGSENRYNLFKQKVYKDFRTSVYYQLEGKDFDINLTTYGSYSNLGLSLDDFISSVEINQLIVNRLSDSIEYNAKDISQIEIPQNIKDYIQTKEDNQILQSLLTTNYKEISNLTQTEKLGTIKPEAVVIETTPKENPPIIIEIEGPPPSTILPIETGAPTYGGGGGGGSTYTSVYTGNMRDANYINYNTITIL